MAHVDDQKSDSHAQGIRTTRLSAQSPSFVMPSEAELRRLYSLVLHRYPRLDYRPRGPETAFGGFCRAFLRLGHLSRGPLNDEYALDSWVDEAVCWLRENEVFPYFITAANFCAAVAAHGDIEYVPLGRFPHDCSAFGLRRDRLGRPASDYWRQVLRTGLPRKPVPLPSSIRV
jgi:hypothetical protein